MKPIALPFLLLAFACVQSETDATANQMPTEAVVSDAAPPANPTPWLHPSGTTINTRFVPNPGFSRPEEAAESWPDYLRNLPLKPHGSPVLYYDGVEKDPQTVHAAVLDVSVGNADLQQCADAVMRLRAEFLWERKDYAAIHFNFVNGFNARYDRWRNGERIWVKGNKTGWNGGDGPTPGRGAFDKYLRWVFMYANTASLEKELHPRKLGDVRTGDVFIHGGFPGHAVIVVDRAVNAATGDVEVLLAQSYMPAQDIHVLRNPARTDGNPWYSVRAMQEEGAVTTPEWYFTTEELRHF